MSNGLSGEDLLPAGMDLTLVPTENSIWSGKGPPGPCNNVGFFACLRNRPPVNFDLDVDDSHVPSQR